EPYFVCAGGGGVTITDVRIDHPGGDVDEYFELAAEPGTSLDGLTYIVIGDGTGGSGVVECVVPLEGFAAPASGYFLAARDDNTLGVVADLITDAIIFENSDNVTHMLVRGFTGAIGDDLAPVLARARETDRTDYDGSTLVPDYSTCAFCGAAGNCVALRRIADTVARAYDPDGYGTSPAVPSETHAARVTDPVALGQLQSLASLMDTFSREVRGANLARALDDPKMVPAGYAVDWAQGRRRVTSPDALRTVCEEFGLTVSDLIESATLSWTKVEALIRDRAPRGGKAVAVERFSERLLEAGAADRDEPTPQLRRNTK
ncbi:MAG: hypothetical protein ACO3CU_12455, partial [Candidatus Nanopelagicales bacterium]